MLWSCLRVFQLRNIAIPIIRPQRLNPCEQNTPIVLLPFFGCMCARRERINKKLLSLVRIKAAPQQTHYRPTFFHGVVFNSCGYLVEIRSHHANKEGYVISRRCWFRDGHIVRLRFRLWSETESLYSIPLPLAFVLKIFVGKVDDQTYLHEGTGRACLRAGRSESKRKSIERVGDMLGTRPLFL